MIDQGCDPVSTTVIVAALPAQIVASPLIAAVGNGFTVTVPLAGPDEQVVAASVIVTVYVPATFDVKLATLPGAGTPAGTVQA